jgi:hypothetical protein
MECQGVPGTTEDVWARQPHITTFANITESTQMGLVNDHVPNTIAA